MFVSLHYKDGGLFTDTKSSQELRARAVLALGFEMGALTPIVTKTKLDQQVILTNDDFGDHPTKEEDLWYITKPINTGMIYTASMQAGWTDQPCKLFLHLEKDLNVDAILRWYFKTSLRWLNDNISAKQVIEQIFKAR